ncbi:uncharacterized protein [Miscanthus floridulus]|uniref:uncharacterized protein n=1 Tax=Miscanthus floridulus TaxID=154761 RepID=UPI00345A9C9D
MCAASMTVTVGGGASTRLWTDNWASVGPLHQFATTLFAAVSRAGRKRLLRDALHNNHWARDITGAPTTQVLCDYLRVWELLRSITLQPLQPDRFVWRWSSSGRYSVSSTYRAFFAGSTRLLGAKELWRAKAPPRVKLFFWLALHQRLWTSERRKRHGLKDEDACALCDQAAETGSHLFLRCVFSGLVWLALLGPLQLLPLMPVGDDDLGEWWIQQRGRIDQASKPLFDSLLLLIAWTV